jgi:hypothetical protein
MRYTVHPNIDFEPVLSQNTPVHQRLLGKVLNDLINHITLVVQRRHLMKARLILISILLLTATEVVGADQYVIHKGFGTGRDYIEMEQSQKRAYVMGAVNGIFLAPLFGATKEKMAWLESSIENMTDMQLVAILSNYLKDNPGRWHEGLHILMYSALIEAFEKSRPDSMK